MSLQDALNAHSLANPGIAFAAARIDAGGTETAYVRCGQYSRFEIGSITKVLTAILLCEGVVEGRCGLDDPLDQWLPEGVLAPQYFGARITLRHLATQTSGLPRLPLGMLLRDARSPQPYANWDRKKLCAATSRAHISRRPGAMYAYSNFGFAVLGLALEKVFGRPYGDLLEDLTKRLGCPDLRLPLPADEEVRARGRAVEPWKFDAFAPAGAATATLDALV